MQTIQHFTTMEEYCRGIGISPPRSNDYDVRSFEENMKTVKHQMPEFKHEFFAIALKLDGGGFATTGNYDTKDLKATIFFNSPYQITQWNIVPDWKGYYVMFTEAFYRSPLNQKRITEQFPFLLNDKAIPLAVETFESESLQKIFSNLYFEYHTKQAHQEEIILHFIQILLLKTARIYYKSSRQQSITTSHRDHDLHTVARFKALIETSFYPDKNYGEISPHQVQFYADQLNIHPNHLNALVKRITDYSASELIQNHLLTLAKSHLRNTNLSVKEIAYLLYYNYPNHFSTFFKKQTGITPNAFRKMDIR